MVMHVTVNNVSNGEWPSSHLVSRTVRTVRVLYLVACGRRSSAAVTLWSTGKTRVQRLKNQRSNFVGSLHHDAVLYYLYMVLVADSSRPFIIQYTNRFLRVAPLASIASCPAPALVARWSSSRTSRNGGCSSLPPTRRAEAASKPCSTAAKAAVWLLRKRLLPAIPFHLLLLLCRRLLPFSASPKHQQQHLPTEVSLLSLPHHPRQIIRNRNLVGSFSPWRAKPRSHWSEDCTLWQKRPALLYPSQTLL